jgi:hypothetical protein
MSRSCPVLIVHVKSLRKGSRLNGLVVIDDLIKEKRLFRVMVVLPTDESIVDRS